MSDALPTAEAVDQLVAAFENELKAAVSLADAKSLRDRYLGRKHSIVASWMQLIGGAPPDQKKNIGQYANALKVAIEARWKTYEETAQNAAPAGGVDVTLPGRRPRLGHRHPLTIVRDRMEEIFTRMGFAIVEGPEVEDEWHCFDALNMPAEHPARDMQDTLYLASPMLPIDGDGESLVRTVLRTHTSSMQIRYMQAHQPPVRIVVPGRVYRRDDLDLTHTPMFSQLEVLVVGEWISLSDLKGTLLAFARGMFGERSRLRFRPSFFPYTEQRRSRHQLLVVRRCGLRDVQRAAGSKSSRLRDGPPAVFEAVATTRRNTPASPGAWASGASRSWLPGRGHPAVLRETTCGSSSGSVLMRTNHGTHETTSRHETRKRSWLCG
jgi:phenylalanyl-tRNA synthetase alpha chain